MSSKFTVNADDEPEDIITDDWPLQHTNKILELEEKVLKEKKVGEII